MNSEYTEGHWEVTGSNVRINQIEIGIRKSISVDPIGCVYGDPRSIETQANARMFAAAPELLSALRQIVETHQPFSKPIGATGSASRKAQEEQEKAIANAKTAIAKAE